ncbi:peroxiredoxin family protein [Paenibacillus sp. FSL R5-0345]|uniref:peroxiredoxin family protein n=1 Tax=Paenibacillus sp. FSL R5-0345 TaxID=1536770 RepID=UPI000A66B7D8|nr:TlpA disulfide reductase family protein [Paenibacillus sp. FSL R5-0345]
MGDIRLQEESISQTNNIQQEQSIEVVGIKKGNEAPDFELLNLEEQPVKLSDFKGKKVILNFWATWCPPCRIEMPHMEKYYTDYKDDTVVLAVNLTNTEKNRANVTGFIEQFGLSFPVVMDSEGDVSSKYQVVAYPTSFIIDSQGIIQEIYQGAINYELIKKALSNVD